MMRKPILALLAGLAMASPAHAQSRPIYIPLPPAQGALYQPDPGPAPHVGVLVMHRTSNYLAHIACTELSKRGFVALCMNARFVNNEAAVRWEQIGLDVKRGVDLLRQTPGITKVLLFGHSGGGATMSFYEAVAENGVAFCQAPGKLTKCGYDLVGLKQADGLILADAHPGNPVQILRGLNPALLNENAPPDKGRKANLDPFSPANGYSATGDTHYSAAFEKRYYVAQAARMQALIASAQAKQARMAAGTYGYPDDDAVLIAGGGNPGPGPGGSAFLNALDPSLAALNTTHAPQKLLKNDGSIARGIVRSVIPPDTTLERTNAEFDTGTKQLTIRSFLSANAIRATDSLDGIDHCSSNNSTTCAVGSIRIPTLVMVMEASTLIRDGELSFERSAARDKDFVAIEGAVHGFTPCLPCEKTPGQYANSVRNLFDYVAAWINARY